MNRCCRWIDDNTGRETETGKWNCVDCILTWDEFHLGMRWFGNGVGTSLRPNYLEFKAVFYKMTAIFFLFFWADCFVHLMRNWL